MSDPKPLSKQRRAEIEADMVSNMEHAMEIIAELLESEAFWRNAVRAAHCDKDTLYNHGGEYEQACPFCDEYLSVNPHKPDCPWLIAS